MFASLIITGTELTRGKVQDSHLKNISSMLESIGVEVSSAVFVPDSSSIEYYLECVSNNSDIIITTGGLGPTDDDITRFAVAHFTKRDLEFNKEAYSDVVNAVGCENSDGSNSVQAQIPKGFKVLHNEKGSACAFYGISDDKKLIISLPGPPSELQPMLEKVRDIVNKFQDKKCENVWVYSVYAVSEAHFNDISLRVLEKMGNESQKVKVGTCFEEKKLILYLYSFEKDAVELYIKCLTDMLKNEESDIERILAGNNDIFYLVSVLLLKKGLTISTAESMTGGLIAKNFTDIAGSSEWFKSGIVSYSDDVKIQELSVDSYVIKKYSAVSAECASMMAEGALKKFGSDISLSMTGYAGPSGDDVGLFYVAVARKGGNTSVFRHKLTLQKRESIRKRAAIIAALHVYHILNI